MPTMTITWHTHPTELVPACPICAPLNNHQWIYVTGQIVPPFLTDPSSGEQVWDVANGEPTTHGEGSRRGPWNCRCDLTWSIDENDLVERIERITLEIGGEIEKWESIGFVKVLRSESGQFVMWRKL